MYDNSDKTQVIVRNSETIGLIGGGQLGDNDLSRIESFTNILVAADSGADHLLSAGRVPAALIGDLDSVSDVARRVIPAQNQHEIADQNTTDFEKCLSAIEAPLILAAGFLGGRLDHHLATCGAIARAGAPRCLLLGAQDVVFAARGTVSLSLSPGTRVSLFPMAAVQGRSTGLHWPIEGLHFAPGGRDGVSNRATGPVTLSVNGAGLLVILPRSALDLAVQALLAQATADAHASGRKDRRPW